MNRFIKNNCYRKDSVWFLDEHADFNYSDGFDEEKYIYDVISNATDISSTSRELEVGIRNWVSRYHLSRERSLAYWPMTITKEMKILEVGSGCGAVTRFFGEQAGIVLALEGSPMRAAITSARVRDLDNVEVLCAPFQDVVFCMKFDLVVFNGVFEYAAAFVDDSEPYEYILDKSKELIKPDGILCIAIENQFGLRYFSSSREDHTNVMFDGIEGYPRFPHGAHTFGYIQLKQMLYKRFKHLELLFPLPDYKLPEAVIRESLLDLVPCADLFASKDSFEHAAVQRPHFHEGLAWHEIGRNKMLSQMANSFLFVASNESPSLFPKGWLGSIYSIHRKSHYTTITNLTETASGKVNVQKEKLEPGGGDDVQDALITQKLNSDLWSNGQSLHTLLAKAMCEPKPKSLEKRLEKTVLMWWSHIKKNNGGLNPDSIDLVWHNSFLHEGAICFIDREWIWNDRVDPEWLIVRAVSQFVAGELPYVHRWAWGVRFSTEWIMMRKVAAICGQTLTFGGFLKAIEAELRLQYCTIGSSDKKWKVVIVAFVPLQIRQYMMFAWKKFWRISFQLKPLQRLLKAAKIS